MNTNYYSHFTIMLLLFNQIINIPHSTGNTTLIQTYIDFMYTLRLFFLYILGLSILYKIASIALIHTSYDTTP